MPAQQRVCLRRRHVRTFSCAEGMSSASRSLSVGCFEATDKKRAEATERMNGELVYDASSMIIRI